MAAPPPDININKFLARLNKKLGRPMSPQHGQISQTTYQEDQRLPSPPDNDFAAPHVRSAAQRPLRAALVYWCVLLASGLTWGVTFSLQIIAISDGAHPIGLNFWHSVAGLFFLAVALLVRRIRVPLTREHLVFYTVCGFFGTVLPGTLYFYAAKYVPAGILAITLATVTILTFALALVLRLERPSLSRALGLGLGITAILMIIAPEDGLPDARAAPWVLVAVICALSYAIENIYISLKRPEVGSAATILCGMMFTATLMTGIVALATDTLFMPALPFTKVEWAVLAMAAINVVCYAAFVFLVTAAGPVFASQMAYVVTLSGVAWGIVIFNEQHSAWIWASIVAMMIGLALVKPRESG